MARKRDPPEEPEPDDDLEGSANEGGGAPVTDAMIAELVAGGASEREAAASLGVSRARARRAIRRRKATPPDEGGDEDGGRPVLDPGPVGRLRAALADLPKPPPAARTRWLLRQVERDPSMLHPIGLMQALREGVGIDEFFCQRILVATLGPAAASFAGAAPSAAQWWGAPPWGAPWAQPPPQPGLTKDDLRAILAEVMSARAEDDVEETQEPALDAAGNVRRGPDGELVMRYRRARRERVDPEMMAQLAGIRAELQAERARGELREKYEGELRAATMRQLTLENQVRANLPPDAAILNRGLDLSERAMADLMSQRSRRLATLDQLALRAAQFVLTDPEARKALGGDFQQLPISDEEWRELAAAVPAEGEAPPGEPAAARESDIPMPPPSPKRRKRADVEPGAPPTTGADAPYHG